MNPRTKKLCHQMNPRTKKLCIGFDDALSDLVTEFFITEEQIEEAEGYFQTTTIMEVLREQKKYMKKEEKEE